MKISYGHKKNVQPKKKTLADVRNERARAEKKKAAERAAQKAKNKPIPVGQHQESSPKTPEAVTPQQVDAEVQAQRLEAKKVKGSRFNFSGLGKYAKKGGKIGLALGLAAGVVALAKWGYDKFFGSDSSQETNPDVKADVPTGDKKSPAQKPATPTPATKTPEDKKTEDKKPEDKKAEGKQKTEKPKTKSNAPVKTPVAVPSPKTEEPEETGNVKGSDKADESGKTDKTDKTDKNPETKVETGEVHKVKLGDNVWNIAKKHLKEQNGVKPTNAEILKHTKEIMELNGLEFEADEKLVIIKPGQELKLTA